MRSTIKEVLMTLVIKIKESQMLTVIISICLSLYIVVTTVMITIQWNTIDKQTKMIEKRDDPNRFLC